jgi:mannosyltransferase OCH1-like enzyme
VVFLNSLTGGEFDTDAARMEAHFAKGHFRAEQPKLIPSKIHYCWFGKGRRSDLLKKCMDSWQRVMPDYQVKEWNETKQSAR